MTPGSWILGPVPDKDNQFSEEQLRKLARRLSPKTDEFTIRAARREDLIEILELATVRP